MYGAIATPSPSEVAMSDGASSILDRVAAHLLPLGFEVHPFLVAWYNEVVADKFRLPFEADALAFVVISRPSMFEKTFLPFLLRRECPRGGDPSSSSSSSPPFAGDPLDDCMREMMSGLAGLLPSHDLVVMHDFELLLPSRRPRVLAQTAAHVAGAARFLREEDVAATDGSGTAARKEKKVFPVCVHPRLGGWFAIRAVVVAAGVRNPGLPRPPPVLPDLAAEEAARVLRLYNDSWRDWSFRDAVVREPEERYSELQREYFSAAPADRWKIVQRLKDDHKKEAK